MIKPKFTLNPFFTLSSIVLFSIAPLTVIADEDEGQEFLFLLDEGYVQESGEWQINALADFDTEESEQELEIEVEYGFTENFQIEVEVEYENEEDASEFGPLGVELSYGWEVSDIAFAIGVNTAIPTESEQDSSYGLSLRSSTDIVDDIFIHGNIGYQEDDNNQEETTYGVALDYEAALRSVAYENTSQTPIELDRTVTISVNDGVVDSNEVARTLSVTSVNDAPELDNIEVSDLAYTENSGMVAVTSALTITDADDTHADSAAVQITANYSTGEDLLSFVNQNGIVGNFDAATGTLSLTGTATLGNYQTALRSVMYQNASDSPSELVRTFTINVDDGLNQSLGVTRNLLVSGENDLPSLTSLETSPLVYAENDDAVTISATISAADLDDDNFESASIAIANYQNGEDLLQFVDQNGIVGTFDAVSGVLTLSGSAAKSDYEIALRSVAYVNQSDSPSELTRTLSFVVNDGDGDSVAVQRDLMVTGSNDSPTLASIEETPLRYQTGDGAVAVSSSLNTDDLDDSDLEGATVQVTSGYQNGEDVLSFSDQNGITGSFDALSGTLSLSGTASVADYEAALHTVAYENTSGTPVAAPRVISFVVNDGDADSDVLAREVAINPPTVSSLEVTPLAVSENDAPTNVTATLVLADVDDTDLQRCNGVNLVKL